MIRPEVHAQFSRWREALIGLALVGAGLWMLTQPALLVRALGVLVALAGLALAVIGTRRARFAPGGVAGGPGVVEIVEGQIVYFAPEGGGFVALDEITMLALSADGRRWLIDAADGGQLAVPLDASGAEALFDAFAALPGIDMARLTRAAREGAATHPRPLWRRDAASALLT
ncbi:MAG: hypothetical protein JJT95_01270 [Pararhodobacter sp.]|nr:hypothetical protein [Pararhodobacter sp.]